MQKKTHTLKRTLFLWIIGFIALGAGGYGAYHGWDYFPLKPRLHPAPSTEVPPSVSKIPDVIPKKAETSEPVPEPTPTVIAPSSVAITEKESFSLREPTPQDIANLLLLRDALITNSPCFIPYQRASVLLPSQIQGQLTLLCTIPDKAPLTDILATFQTQKDACLEDHFITTHDGPKALKQLIYTFVKITPLSGIGAQLTGAETALSRGNISETLRLLGDLPPHERTFFQGIILQLNRYQVLVQTVTETLLFTLKKEGV